MAVFVHEGESSDDPPTFDESYTYVRSPQIHSSVMMEGQDLSSLKRKAHNPELAGSLSAVAAACHCYTGREDMPYLSTGLLHPRYIKQVRNRSLSVYNIECVRLNASVSIPEK